MKIVLAVLFLTAAGISHGQQIEVCGAGPKAVDCFIGQTQYAFTMCRLKTKLGVANGQPLTESTACIGELKVAMDGNYKTVARSVAKKSAAVGALKDYYAYWQASMSEIAPRSGETERTWDRRLEDRSAVLEERANRLALEK